MNGPRSQYVTVLDREIHIDKAVIPQSSSGAVLSPASPSDMPVDARGWPRYRGQ